MPDKMTGSYRIENVSYNDAAQTSKSSRQRAYVSDDDPADDDARLSLPMESLNLNNLASSLPSSSYALAEKDLSTNFKGTSLPSPCPISHPSHPPLRPPLLHHPCTMPLATHRRHWYQLPATSLTRCPPPVHR